MYNLDWDMKFKRSYKKRIAKNQILKFKFWNVIEIFSNDPFDDRLRTHKLTGDMKECWAFSVAYDCRIIFKFKENKRILLVDVGSHNEVY